MKIQKMSEHIKHVCRLMVIVVSLYMLEKSIILPFPKMIIRIQDLMSDAI